MRTLDWIALVLMIIGGLLWGFVGIANYNFLGGLMDIPGIWIVVYALVGLSGIWTIISAFIKLDHCVYRPLEIRSSRPTT